MLAHNILGLPCKFTNVCTYSYVTDLHIPKYCEDYSASVFHCDLGKKKYVQDHIVNP